MTELQETRGAYTLSSDKSLLQVDRVHRFLSTDAYWSVGIPIETVSRAIENSICLAIYETGAGQAQVAFLRVVTDRATFAWICDVYVENYARGHTLGKWLVEAVLRHPELKGLRRICLATKDAHALYLKFGFKITETPGNWLEIKDNDVYRSS